MGFGEGEESLGIGVVEPHHRAAVPGGRVDTGPLMEDGGERGKGTERGEQFVAIEVVGKRLPGEVRTLHPLGEIVDGEDVGLPAGIERGEDVRADEAGGTGEEDHGEGFRDARMWSTMFVVETFATNSGVATRPPRASTRSAPTTSAAL